MLQDRMDNFLLIPKVGLDYRPTELDARSIF